MILALKWYHWVAHYAVIMALCVVSVLAWIGFHRPTQVQYVDRKVVQVQPGQTRTVYVTVNGQRIPQVVTAPSPTVRIITSPAAPVIVQTPAQSATVEQQANIVVSFDELRRCVHPDIVGPPDPTCGKPVHPNVELVQNGAGFVRVTTPDDDLQTGPITTQFNRVQTESKMPRFDATIAAGASSLFGGTTYLRGELRYHPLSGIFQPVYVGAGYRRFSGGPMQSEGTLEVGATFTF